MIWPNNQSVLLFQGKARNTERERQRGKGNYKKTK